MESGGWKGGVEEVKGICDVSRKYISQAHGRKLSALWYDLGCRAVSYYKTAEKIGRKKKKHATEAFIHLT